MSAPRIADYPVHSMFTERWSPRAFSGEPIPEADLFTLLEAARWAPSAYNAQPWRFVYVRRDTESWQPVFESLVEFNRGWAQRASALVVVASAIEATFPGREAAAPNPWHAFDAGAAWANLALQASLSGWAAHAMAGFDAHALRKVIALPQDYAIQTVIAIGRRADRGVLPEALQAREVPNERRSLLETVSEGRFSAGV